MERRALRKRQQHNASHLADNVAHNDTTPTVSFGAKESYWIDIETPTRSTDELHDFLNQLRLPPFFVSGKSALVLLSFEFM